MGIKLDEIARSKLLLKALQQRVVEIVRIWTALTPYQMVLKLF